MILSSPYPSLGIASDPCLLDPVSLPLKLPLFEVGMGAHNYARMLTDRPPPPLVLPSLPHTRTVCWGRAPWSGLVLGSASLMGP